jgi:hypothetical protein
MWKYDVTTNAWTQVIPASSPPARAGACTWTVRGDGGRFYLYSGRASNASDASFDGSIGAADLGNLDQNWLFK